MTAITVKNLETASGSTIDLSYANTTAIPADGDLPYAYRSIGDHQNYAYLIAAPYNDSGSIKYNTVRIDRSLLVDNAKLADNTTFRLGVYQQYDDWIFTATARTGRGA